MFLSELLKVFRLLGFLLIIKKTDMKKLYLRLVRHQSHKNITLNVD